MLEKKIFKGKSILLVAPTFFGYESAIKDKLTELGANVTYIDDRPNNSFFVKGVIRVYRKLLDSTILKYYADVTSNIAEQEFDIVFLLNPEAMPISFLQMCRKRWKDAFFVMYMWDSIKNKKHTLEYVLYCDRVFTFDKNDARSHDLNFKPLFYLDAYSPIRQDSAPIIYDLCFMGTVHSDRYSVVKEVKDWCDDNGLRCYFYLYMHRKTFYYINKLVGKTGNPPFKDVSFKKLSANEIVNIVKSSQAILDIEHFNQTGLTMRTLETIGAGKKLITTNPEVKAYDFYDERRVMVIDRFKPGTSLNLNFFLEDDSKIPEATVESYSIGAWLKNILNCESPIPENTSIDKKSAYVE